MTVSPRAALIRDTVLRARDGPPASRPRGRPALLGRAEALDGVRVRLAQVADELVALVLDAARGVEPEAAVDLPLDRRQRAARLAGEARRQLRDGVVELGGGNAAQHESERRGLAAAHHPARVDQLAGLLHADGARQPDR